MTSSANYEKLLSDTGKNSTLARRYEQEVFPVHPRACGEHLCRISYKWLFCFELYAVVSGIGRGGGIVAVPDFEGDIFGECGAAALVLIEGFKVQMHALVANRADGRCARGDLYDKKEDLTPLRFRITCNSLVL